MSGPTLTPIAPDAIDAALIADAADALRGAAVAGRRVFDRVTVVDSLDAFTATAQTTAGAVCAVLPGQTQRAPGMDNSDEYLARLSLTVLVGASANPSIDADCADTTARLANLVSAARAALRADPYRGGRACAIMWGGRILRGTDADAEPRPLSRTLKTAPQFYGATIPVVIGYAVPRG